MGSVALIRSMVSKEGDHERGTYLMKTGYRPDPTVEHPSIGAICCHELPVGSHRHPPAHLDPDRPVAQPGRVPGRRIRRLPGRRPQGRAARRRRAAVSPAREQARFRDLEVLERAFARGRQPPGREPRCTARRSPGPAS